LSANISLFEWPNWHRALKRVKLAGCVYWLCYQSSTKNEVRPHWLISATLTMKCVPQSACRYLILRVKVCTTISLQRYWGLKCVPQSACRYWGLKCVPQSDWKIYFFETPQLFLFFIKTPEASELRISVNRLISHMSDEGCTIIRSACR
jgi:hypothetical protein